jgi:hypothetical protein
MAIEFADQVAARCGGSTTFAFRDNVLRVLLLKLYTARLAAFSLVQPLGRLGVFLSRRLYCVQSRHFVPAGN